ncbi:exosortase C-terminal domain/associated protein EpsI [Lentisphaera araneosa]|nr:exosortase C-terminal domain/associated protein EpsI [Lentisphaera araneosa]
MIKRNSKLLSALTCGVLMYLFMSVFEPLINFPLRQFSSNFSYAFLQLFISDIEINGTIIISHGIKFDVVPACSGSSTLKYILSFGTILCVLSNCLSIRKFSYCFISLVFMAVCFNSLRISTLIIMGIITSNPIEGLSHSIVGMIWFTISMMSIHLFLRFSNKQKLTPQNEGNRKEICLGIIYFIIFSSFLIDTLEAWVNSPLDKHSWIFFIMSCFLIKTTLVRVKYKKNKKNVPSVAFLIVQILIVNSLFFDINAIWFMAFIMLICTYIIQLKGLVNLHLFLPALMVLFCAFPVSSYLITTYGPLPSNLQSDPLVVKFALCILMTISYLFLPLNLHKQLPLRQNLKRIKHSYLVILIFAVSSLILHNGVNEKTQIKPSYVIGPWTGEKQQIPLYLSNFFENGQVICREYKSGEEAVQLMISVHNNERHSMHSPEYCLKGANWKITQSEILTLNNKSNIKLINVSRGTQTRYYAYWFAQNEEFYTDMIDVLSKDISLRLRGQPRNWQLTRIKGQNKEQIMNFINHYIYQNDYINLTESIKTNLKEFDHES